MVRDLWIRSPDIGTTTAGNIGLYDTTENGGAVVDADFFGSAVNLAGGALEDVNITFESGVVTLANCTKRIWEHLGLSSDPGKNYDVVLTLTGASDAAGGVRLKMDCVQG